MAHGMINDALCTTLAVRYPPQVLAAACLSLAFRTFRSNFP